MELNVALIRQAKNSRDCGIAGLYMILNYYGINSSISELKKEIEIDEFGTYAPQLGSYLIKHGFNVEISNLNPRLFTRQNMGNSKKDLINNFNEVLKKCKTKRDRKVMKYFIRFLSDGGKVTPKIPDKKDIISEIRNKRPITALLTTNFLLGSKPNLNSHFNVITGIDDKKIYVNDPLPDARGGKHNYPISDFLFGLYAGSNGDFDNGSLIKIKKK